MKNSSFKHLLSFTLSSPLPFHLLSFHLFSLLSLSVEPQRFKEPVEMHHCRPGFCERRSTNNLSPFEFRIHLLACRLQSASCGFSCGQSSVSDVSFNLSIHLSIYLAILHLTQQYFASFIEQCIYKVLTRAWKKGILVCIKD